MLTPYILSKYQSKFDLKLWLLVALDLGSIFSRIQMRRLSSKTRKSVMKNCYLFPNRMLLSIAGQGPLSTEHMELDVYLLLPLDWTSLSLTFLCPSNFPWPFSLCSNSCELLFLRLWLLSHHEGRASNYNKQTFSFPYLLAWLLNSLQLLLSRKHCFCHTPQRNTTAMRSLLTFKNIRRNFSDFIFRVFSN